MTGLRSYAGRRMDANRNERQRQTWRRDDGGTQYGGRRQGTPEDSQTRDVQSPDAERRLHPDGVRRACSGTVLPEKPGRGDPHHVTRASPRSRGVRRIHLRSRRDKSDPGHGPGSAEPASSPVYDREGMMALFGGKTGMCMAETPERTNLALKAETPGRSRAVRSAKNQLGTNAVWMTGGAVAPPGIDRVPHRTASV